MASQASLSKVQSLYVAYYGRPADPLGLDFWATVVDAHGGDVSVIMQDFGNSTEFQVRFGNLDTTTLVNNIYLQTFGRNAEPDGLNFWVGVLANGSQTRIQVAQTIASLATENDLQVLMGRVELASAFTSNLATNPLALAYFDTVAGLQISRDYLNQVKSTTVANVSAYVTKAAETVATLLPSTGVYIPLPTGSLAVATVSSLSADNGVSATDFITNTALQTVHGNYTGTLGAGEQIQVKLDNGTWQTTTLEPGTSNWSLSGVTLANASGTLAVQTINATGNVLAGNGHSYGLDTTKPTASSISYQRDGQEVSAVNVTSNEAGTTGLYDADSKLIAGTTPTQLTADVQGSVAIAALSALTVATAKVQDVAGNLADAGSIPFFLGTTGADTFSSTQNHSTSRYGFAGDDIFEFESNDTLGQSGVQVFGGDGIDTVKFTTAFDALNNGNLNADVGGLHSVEKLQLFGASSINMGGEVATAGINTILTGNDNTTIRYDNSDLGQMTVDGTALATGKSLTLTKFGATANFVVTNLHGDLDSTAFDDNITVTAVSSSGVSISTGSGNDTLTGSAGNDVINAGNGTNSITGGQGVDMLTGGGNVDTFNFVTGDAAGYVFTASSSADTIISDGDTFLLGTGGTDVINNFTAGTDKLSITGVSLTSGYLGGGSEAAANVSNGHVSFVLGSYGAASHTFSVNSNSGSATLVIFNADNSRESIVLTGVTSLTVADFNGVGLVA